MKNAVLVAIAALIIATPALAQNANQKEQLRRSLGNLDQMDANKDGTVTRAELNAGRAAMFARFDRNKDSQLTADDIPTGMGLLGGNQMFDQMKATYDANKDGKVSRAEFTNGPTPGFNLADANKDNQVTKAELDAAMAKLK